MKISTQLVIFFIGFNAVAGAFAAAGLWQGTGVAPSTSAPDDLENAQSEYNRIEASGNSCQTLVCTTVRLAGNVRAAYASLLPGMAMLNDVGVPSIITGMFTGVIGFVAGRDLIVFLLNR